MAHFGLLEILYFWSSEREGALHTLTIPRSRTSHLPEPVFADVGSVLLLLLPSPPPHLFPLLKISHPSGVLKFRTPDLPHSHRARPETAGIELKPPPPATGDGDGGDEGGRGRGDLKQTLSGGQTMDI